MFNIKARLAFTQECDRGCSYCANRLSDRSPEAIVWDDLINNYSEINITGGEPLTSFYKLLELIHQLKRQKKKVYVYTGKVVPKAEMKVLVGMVDGVTLTLHSRNDFVLFITNKYNEIYDHGKSLRVKFFDTFNFSAFGHWKPEKIDKLKYCPIPEDEDYVYLKVNLS